MSEFLIEFAVDGQLTVVADTIEAAQRAAIDVLECVDCMAAESFEPIGCTVKVAAKVDGNERTPIENSVQQVEFA